MPALTTPLKHMTPEQYREYKRVAAMKYRRKIGVLPRPLKGAAVPKSRTKEAMRRANRKALLKKYGMTHDDHAALLLAQGHECPICRTAVNESSPIDHDHATGLVRGVLCTHCNVGLGHFRDDTDRLMSAVAYLKEH